MIAKQLSPLLNPNMRETKEVIHVPMEPEDKSFVFFFFSLSTRKMVTGNSLLPMKTSLHTKLHTSCPDLNFTENADGKVGNSLT